MPPRLLFLLDGVDFFSPVVPCLDYSDVLLLLHIRLGRESEYPYQAHRQVHRGIRAVAARWVDQCVETLSKDLKNQHG